MASLLQQLLDVSADRHPDKPAVRARERSLTYAELHARSSQLAHLLRAVDVPQVDHQWSFKKLAHAREVKRTKFVPLRQDHDSVGS